MNIDEKYVMELIEKSKNHKWHPKKYKFTPISWRSDGRDIQIDLCKQSDGRNKFAVRLSGCCLNKNCELVQEPLPSSRTEEFLSECRFESFDKAYEIAEKYLDRNDP